MPTTGYSGTPLAKKLGIKDSSSLQIINTPKPSLDFFIDFPPDTNIHTGSPVKEEVDFIHIFATIPEELKYAFNRVKPNLKKNGTLWISWPKKSSSISTELDKSMVRNYGLENELVDTKVASIDADWSGHKFMFRLKDR
ncbi:MAG: DUF3052 domain-containing protein [Maribacter sp.]